MELIESLQCDAQEGRNYSSENFERVDTGACSSDMDDEKKNEANTEDKPEDSPNGKKTIGGG